MSNDPKEIVMLVAKDLTVKLMEKITYKQEPLATVTITNLVDTVGEIYQLMTTKVSQVLTNLG